MAAILMLLFVFSAPAADTFEWRKKEERVSADIKSGTLTGVLGEIARATGWQVFVEPDTRHVVSAKFKELPPGEALRLLLGDLSYALVPETNGSPKLFVFRTSRKNATQLVLAPGTQSGRAKIIANELIVRLKAGSSIDELARLLGAKVVGRLPGLNAYRLEFESAEAASSAREQLAANPEIAAVENNYEIDRPNPGRENASNVQPPRLQLRPPPENGRVVIGLIDTSVQSLGSDLDKFFLKGLSVAGEVQPNADTPTHGTSMAETLLRSLEMMTKGNTSVQILPIDVYGPKASTSTFDVANGIVLAINNGANILNLSLGSEGDSPVLRDLIREALQKNIAVFAAAGNEPTTTPFYPAAYSDLGVFAVTATEHGQLAPYANRGSFVNAAAPGTSAFSYNGQTWYAVGTSASTAVASGMAAGYLDTTHAGMDKMQSFIRSTLGVKKSPGP